MVMETAEQVDEFQIFEYSLRYRMPFLFFLGGTLGFYFLLIVPLVSLTLYRKISGQMVLERVGAPGDLGTFLVFLFLPPLMILGFYTLNIGFPAVHIKEDGFRIKRLSYTSQWFDWGNIHNINISRYSILSKRQELTTVTIKGLGGGFLSFIGVVLLQANKEGFAVTSNIDNYKELLERFRNKRPDLFE